MRLLPASSGPSFLALPFLSLACLALACLAVPAAARDSLGVFGSWGAFRDPQVPRCYAIAAAQPATARRVPNAM